MGSPLKEKNPPSARVASILELLPDAILRPILRLRRIILRTASNLPIGEVEETVRWGQVAYVTRKGIGSTIRIGAVKGSTERYAIYFHCQTNLIATFKKKYRGKFHFEGNRAILFNRAEKIHSKELVECISMALTYHRTTLLVMKPSK